ncbi:5'-methylthioadenosine/adenosylhomocysteine nucleosidase [Calidifontibacillus oryziterrae]|uniref:5'-methylthioadenosine/adenosylhomocysteine nucleosidase n=1 Tax=Calidifontibacillus oryziterrae TaxID=1191699 RepID=UPI0002E1FEB4|nr:5'-methylthioadenosine/adenosylhomocysteine nucleosidase [Calidifontibacillus oryziterrae]
MTIGIIGAMNEEIEALLSSMIDITKEVKAEIEYYRGVINGHNVVVCKSGVGKVNASICTQILIDRFQASKVLFTGVAGAVDPTLNIGDIVISVDCMQHDMDATALGFKEGEIPFMDRFIFKADDALITLASKVSDEEVNNQAIIKGRILSGDQFVANREKVKQLFEKFEGSCTEMEGAAVAQVCSMNNVPFVIIRSISDKADGSANSNFLEFVKYAADNSYKIIVGMLERMS